MILLHMYDRVADIPFKRFGRTGLNRGLGRVQLVRLVKSNQTASNWFQV